MQEVCQGITDERAGPGKGRLSQGIAALCGQADFLRGWPGTFEQRGRQSFGQLVGHKAGDGRPGSERFQMAAVTAAAKRPAGQDGDVAQLGGQPARAGQQVVVDDHAAANASADGQVEQVAVANPCPEAPFAQRGQVGVVAHHHGHVEALLQKVAQGEVDPAGNVGRVINDAQAVIDVPRGDRANPQHAVSDRPELLQQADQPVSGGMIDGCGVDAFLSQRNDAAVRRKYRGSHVRSANIDGQIHVHQQIIAWQGD